MLPWASDGPVLIADLLAVLVFVLLGRRSHEEGSALAGTVATAWPFVAGAAVGELGPPYGGRRIAGRRRVVTAGAVGVGMPLRRLAGGGTPLSFVLVATTFLAVFLVGWRVAARRWSAGGRRVPTSTSRSRPGRRAPPGAPTAEGAAREPAARRDRRCWCGVRTGQVLVHRRSATKDLWPGRLDGAFGGVLLAGEAPEAAARRELAEEAGIDDPDLPMEPLGRLVPRRDTWYLAHVFAAVWDGPVRFTDGEVEAAWWEGADAVRTALADPATPYVPDTRRLLGRSPGEQWLAGSVAAVQWASSSGGHGREGRQGREGRHGWRRPYSPEAAIRPASRWGGPSGRPSGRNVATRE